MWGPNSEAKRVNVVFQLLLESQARGRVVVLMGSTSDLAHCEKIRKACSSFGIPCTLRVTSAHKGPDETLRIKAEYEGELPEVSVCEQGPCSRVVWLCFFFLFR